MAHMTVRSRLPAAANSFSAWMIVRQKDTPFISIPIDDDMNARFDMVS